MKVKLSERKQAEIVACLDKIESVTLKKRLTYQDQDDIKLAVAILRDRLFNGLSKREEKVVKSYVECGNVITNENARRITEDFAQSMGRTTVIFPEETVLSFPEQWKQPELKVEISERADDSDDA